MSNQEKTIKILVVEDEAIVALDIEQGLLSVGYEVCGIAASGNEAVEIAKTEHPDLVLMDIRLQGSMTGIDAAHEIRARFGIPVVFLTAHSDDATPQAAKLAQPFGYLLKPFGLRELRAAIETALYKAEADRKLSQAEKWERAIIEAAPTAFVAMDIEGRIVDWNPVAQALFGWSKSEIKGRLFVDVLIPEKLRSFFSNAFENNREQNIQEFFNQTMEQYCLTKSGMEIPVEITISRVEIDGVPRFFTYIKDISKRRQYELQRARAEELERANRDLDRFAHLASHDLQEPLRTLSMYTQILESSIDSKINDEERVIFDHIKRSAKRMSVLVNELLKYSRIGICENFELVEVSSKEALEEALENISGIITRVGVKVLFEDLPVVRANKVQLEQVFQNLLVNAIKFRSSKPVVIKISAAREGEFWRFEVADNGRGFDPQFATQIFEMFRRVHGECSIPGTGAGLAICKKVIGLHGGRIWAESEPDQGSKFFFTLPCADPMKSEDGALTGIRILLVDSDPEAKALATHILNGTGAVIDHVGNGFKAIDKAKVGKYHLVLMEIQMPIIDGVETSRRMKFDGIDCPVVAYTDMSADRVKSLVPHNFFVDVIPKSLPRGLLVDRISAWVEKN